MQEKPRKPYNKRERGDSHDSRALQSKKNPALPPKSPRSGVTFHFVQAQDILLNPSWLRKLIDSSTKHFRRKKIQVQKTRLDKIFCSE